MPNRSRKTRKPESEADDPNVVAFKVIQQATQERPTGPERFAHLIREIRDGLEAGETPEALADRLWPRAQQLLHGSAAAELGRKGGKKGGTARANKLSPERRAEIAKKAAAARWDKARPLKVDEG